MFRLLKLDPPHGWRTVIWELAIVTLGVLIALAAQQWVEVMSWHQKVRDADQQLKAEAVINFTYAAEQITTEPCIQAQLEALRLRLMDSGATLQPAMLFREPMMMYVFRQPSRTFESNGWQSLVADDTANHIAPDRSKKLSTYYSQLTKMEGLSGENDSAVGHLNATSQPMPLDSATRAHFVELVYDQIFRTRSISLMALQGLGTQRDLGLAPDGQRVDRFLNNYSGTVRFCRAHDLPMADWRRELAGEKAEQFPT